MPTGLSPARAPPKRGGQPELVGQLAKQRRPGVPGDAVAIAGDLEP
jgi:hypothetical protein